MSVSRHVDGRTGHRDGDVGTVIEVEAAQIVLIGLSFAAVLADHDARDRLENVARALNRAAFDLLGGDDPDGCGIGNSDQTVDRLVHLGQIVESPLAGDDDL